MPALPSSVGDVAAELAVRRRTVAVALFGATGIVIGLGLVRYALILAFGRETFFGAFRIIDFDGEGTLPAWYSSALMLLAAVLLFVLHRLSIRERPENATPWLVLAVIFLLLSLDEAVSLHEALTEPLRNGLGATGFLYFAWVVAAAPILVAVALSFVPLLRRLPRAVARRIILAGAIFVFGAFGMEMVGASQFDGAAGNARYHLATALEEIGEMVGLALFVLVLYDLVAGTAPSLTVRFTRT